MITAKALSKQYKNNTALQNLDLHVERGCIYALLGANGAGKSTTVNLFMGFIEPTGGEAFINNIPVRSGGAQTKSFAAYIPENVMLYPHLTGLQNLRFFSGLNGKALSESQLANLLSCAGLPTTAHRQKVSTYSKGMRQKVGIALALAKEATALFLDEPTSGLDPLASNDFSAILHALKRQGVAVLMVTHDLFRAKETADRIGIMKEGKLMTELAAQTISTAQLEQEYVTISQS